MIVRKDSKYIGSPTKCIIYEDEHPLHNIV